MRRGRALIVSTLAAATLFATSSGLAVADDEGDKNALLAAAQFQLFILSTTDFVPSEVTCTPPLVLDQSGTMLCYALIGERVSVAAIAAMESPGVYTFTALNKIDPADLAPATASPSDVAPPAAQNAADQAVLATIDDAVANADGLGGIILDNNESIESVDAITYHAPTATVQVTVTTSAADAGIRDSLAFYVTDVMAYPWEEDEPFRDPEATIRPRLEVIVDGVVYGSAFDVMAGVADYTISEAEWIEIVTGNAAGSSDSRSIDEVTRKPRREDRPHEMA